MTGASAPEPTPAAPSGDRAERADRPDRPGRALSWRAFAVGLASMALMAIWIHFHEVLVARPQPLAENSPPAAAVGVLLAVLGVGALVTVLRPRLRLGRGELTAIYAMLLIAAPLMSQGMWHRFLGLTVAIPHNQQNLVLYDAYSDRLWPHGPHLAADRAFADADSGTVRVTGGGELTRVDIPDSQRGATTGLELRSAPAAAPDAAEPAELRVRIPRDGGGGRVLEPGTLVHLSLLLRAAELSEGARVDLALESDRGTRVEVASVLEATRERYSQPGGFQRVGDPYVAVPRDLADHAEVVITLTGRGRVTVTDLTLFDNQALSQLHTGTLEARAGEAAGDALPPGVLLRPEHDASAEGLAYRLRGYVPWRQWAGPLGYWLAIVLAIFGSMYALGVLFRGQWADRERFGFPLIVLPRMLLEEREIDGRTVRPVWRSGSFRLGIGVAAGYGLLLGLGHYVSGFPQVAIDLAPADYVESAAAKAFIDGQSGGLRFQVVLVFVAIAAFVDLQLLASLLVFLVIAHVPYAAGEVFGWKLIEGPQDSFPFAHEQHIGAFLSVGLIVLWVSRQHLAGVARAVVRGGAEGRGDEAISYRAAVAMLLASFVCFALWGAATGLGTGNSLLFFGFLVVCGLVAARIRTEFGAPAAYFTPYFPFLVFYLLGGLETFRLETMLLAYVAGGFMAVAQFLLFAPSQVEMLQLSREQRVSAGGVSVAMWIGVAGGVLMGGYVMLVWAYGVGGDNIPYMRDWALHQDWYFTSLRQAVVEADTQSFLDSGAEAAAGAGESGNGPAIAAVGVGAGVTLAIAALRSVFVGFWLNPIGYVLANTFFVYAVWGSVLVAWAVKWLALKTGGPRLVREQLTPFFGGVFVGSVGAAAFWDLIAAVLTARGVQDVFVVLP